MKLREFLNTCQNDIEEYDLYFEDVEWDNWEPAEVFFAVRDIRNALLDRTVVDAWVVDANFHLHVLLS